MDALARLTLPDGTPWREAFEADQWIERDVLTPILERNPDGTPRYRVVWIELPRGHAKTSLVAGVAMVSALLTGGVNAFALASDKEQAGLVLEALDGQCRRNRRLGQRFKQGRDLYTVKSTGSFIRVLPSDVPSAFGLAPDARRLLFILDEVTQWRDRALFDMAMTTLPKVPDAQLIVITNAGVRGSWQEEARRQVEALVDTDQAYLFAAEDVIASWIRPADLALAEATTHPTVFNRYYKNRWVDSEGAFVTPDDIARCVDPTWHQQLTGQIGTTYIAAYDLGLVKDRTARAVVHRDDETQRIVLDSLRVWQGTKDSPVLIADIEDDMRQVARAFNSPNIYADPWQLQSTIQRLRGELAIEEFVFSAESVRRLSETLYNLLHNGHLRLFPDPDLERELLRLEMKQSGYGWRLDHKSGGFSDRAIALAMACLEAQQAAPHQALPRENVEGASPARPGGRLAGLPTHPEVGGGRRSSSRLAGLPGRIRGGPHEPPW